ncbi:MAG: hypothetical protein CMO60_03255, partial [Verrucomicrobiales bacterium]|nr:hypothetical protein [Verrucomicrobiales bacterium]
MSKFKSNNKQTMKGNYSTKANIARRNPNCGAKMAEQERYLRLLSALLGQSYAESVKTVITPETLS